MMHHCLGVAARPNLYRLDAAVCGDGALDIVIAPKVGAIGRYIHGDRRDDDIGLAKLVDEVPLVGVIQHGRWHCLIGITQNRALINPGHYGIDIFLLQAPISLQLLDADAVIVGIGGASPYWPLEAGSGEPRVEPDHSCPIA